MTIYYLVTFLAGCIVCGRVMAEISILLEEKTKEKRNSTKSV